MNQHAAPGSSLSEEVRFRVPLPLVIPIVSLLVIAATTVGMSRILLSVPKEVAVIVALAISANVLIACAVIAARPETARATWPELLIVFLYPVIIGAVLTQMNLGAGHGAVAEEAGEKAAGSESGSAAGGTTAVAASGTAFDTETLELTAGEETEIDFANEDSQQHNISIYEEEGGADLFLGELVPPGQAITYTIPGLDKGNYYFQCDVHPGMNGEVTVK